MAARLGYVARGVVHLTIGLVALPAAAKLVPRTQGALGALEAWRRPIRLEGLGRREGRDTVTIHPLRGFLVEPSGIEPLTSSLRTRRSTI